MVVTCVKHLQHGPGVRCVHTLPLRLPNFYPWLVTLFWELLQWKICLMCIGLHLRCCWKLPPLENLLFATDFTPYVAASHPSTHNSNLFKFRSEIFLKGKRLLGPETDTVLYSAVHARGIGFFSHWVHNIAWVQIPAVHNLRYFMNQFFTKLQIYDMRPRWIDGWQKKAKISFYRLF